MATVYALPCIVPCDVNMSSKSGVSSGSVKLCQGKDVLERMNYLYQASHLMALQSKNPVAASYYGNIMVGCAKKAVLRINPAIKRTVCKSCQSPLVPGETARVRLVSKPTKMVKWTCLVCNGTKKFPTKKGYRLWADEPEALVEFFDYTPKPIEVGASEQFQETGKLVKASSSNPSVDHETHSTMEISENIKEVNSSEMECDSKFEDQNNLGKDLNLKSEFSVKNDESIICSNISSQ